MRKFPSLLIFVTALGANAHATPVQIAPNPNPMGSTITVNAPDQSQTTDFAVNDEDFHNLGVLQIESIGALYNRTAGSLNNSGILDNNGDLYNAAFLNNGDLDGTSPGILNNDGNLYSEGWINNFLHSEINNMGTLELGIAGGTGGYLYNNGDLNNGGLILGHTGAEIDNVGTLTNNSELVVSGTLSNDGILNNRGLLSIERELGASPARDLGADNFGTLNNEGLLSLLDGELNNFGTLNNDGVLELRQDFYNDGILNNNWLINNVGQTVINDGTVSNTDRLFNLGGSSTLINNGILSNNSGGQFGLVNEGTLTNNGTLNNNGNLYNEGLLNNSGDLINNAAISTFEGTGTYMQTAGQTINNGGFTQSAFQFDGGSLSGTGNLNGLVNIASGATVNPGDPLGTLTVNGDFYSSGNLIFELGGVGLGLFDVLSISGDAFFMGGSAEFRLVNSFIASDGDYWDFLLADSISGWDTLSYSFTNLNPGLTWSFASLATGGERLLISSVRSTRVPEPSTLALLGLGLAGIGFSRKKRVRGVELHARSFRG